MNEEADDEGDDQSEEEDAEDEPQQDAPPGLGRESHLRGRQGVHIVPGRRHVTILPSCGPWATSLGVRFALLVVVVGEERVVVAGLQQSHALVTNLSLQRAEGDVPQEVARHPSRVVTQNT